MYTKACPKKFNYPKKPISAPEKHWSEIHKIREKREIKWTIAGTLAFWVEDRLDRDFLTPAQQLTFDKAIFILRDSLNLVFPRISDASTRLEFHRILDQIEIGFKRNKSTKSAHMLQEEFENGIFKYKAPQKKGRPPARDKSSGDIDSISDITTYIKDTIPKFANKSFHNSEAEFQSYFAQLKFSAMRIFNEPDHFQKRVELRRLLDEAYIEFKLGNHENGIQGLILFEDTINRVTKTQNPQGFLRKLASKLGFTKD